MNKQAVVAVFSFSKNCSDDKYDEISIQRGDIASYRSVSDSEELEVRLVGPPNSL